MFTMGAKLDGDEWDTSKNKPKKNEQKEVIDKNQHQLVFTFEKRRGKPVTLVGRFYLDDKEKKDILKILKSKLGCGGTISGEWIEIQGDKKDKIKEVLSNLGWKFKK